MNLKKNKKTITKTITITNIKVKRKTMEKVENRKKSAISIKSILELDQRKHYIGMRMMNKKSADTSNIFTCVTIWFAFNSSPPTTTLITSFLKNCFLQKISKFEMSL